METTMRLPAMRFTKPFPGLAIIIATLMGFPTVSLAEAVSLAEDEDDAPERRVVEPGQGPQFPFDESRWEFWWHYNKGPLLGVRKALLSDDAMKSDSDLPFLKVRERDRDERVLPGLVSVLRDENPDVRMAALQALAKTRDPSVRPYLFAALHDPNYPVRLQAIIALGVWGNTVSLPRLEEIVVDKDRELQERLYASVAIGMIGGPLTAESFKQFLAPGAFEKFPSMVQAGLAYGVGIGRDPANALLIRGLLDRRSIQNYTVRSYLALSLGKCGDDSDLERFARYLQREPETQVRRSSAIALGVLFSSTANEDASKVLIGVVSTDADLMVRNFSYLALGRIGGESATDCLRSNFRTTTTVYRPFIALALALTKNVENVPILLEELKAQSDTSYRAALSIALGLLRDKQAAASLRKEMTEAGDPVLRGYIALGLGLVGDVDSLPLLSRTLENANDVQLITNTALSIGLLGDREAVQLISDKAKKEKNPFVEQSLLYSIGLVGARSDIDFLAHITEDSREPAYVRSYGTIALGMLGDPLPVPEMALVTEESNYTIVSTFLNDIFSIL